MIPASRSAHGLGKTGHGEARHAPGLEMPRHRHGPVAVGVGLDHGHQLTAGGQGPLEGPGVVRQGVQVNFPPGPGQLLFHGVLLS